MKARDRDATIARLRALIVILRKNAHEGHMPYVVDALELAVDLIEDKPRT